MGKPNTFCASAKYSACEGKTNQKAGRLITSTPTIPYQSKPSAKEATQPESTRKRSNTGSMAET